MADDEGRGRVLDLPLVRLFSPPDAAPPESVAAPPADTEDGRFPALPAVPAEPPESLTLPPPLVLAGNDEDQLPAAATAAEGEAEGGPVRTAASNAMVLAAGIAVACLKGAWNVVEYVKARAEHHQAVKDKAKKKDRSGRHDRRDRVPSGPEFGRTERRRRRNGTPSGSWGFGPGGRRRRRRDGGPGKDGPGRGRHGSDGLTRRTPKESRRKARKDAAARKRAEKLAARDRRRDRPGGDDTTAVKKPGSGAGGSGGRRKPKTGALEKEAARRLKRRRKHPDAPAISLTKPKPGKPGAKDPKARRKKPGAGPGSTSAKGPGTGSRKGAAPGGPKKPGNRKPGRTHTPGGRPGGRPWEKNKKKRKKPGKPGASGAGRAKARQTRQERGRPRNSPGPGEEWLKPPPGWTVGTSYTVTQDGPARRHRRPPPAAVTRGQRVLPRVPEHGVGPRPGTTARPGTSPPPSRSRPAGGLVTAPVVRTTQYADSDLTIHDVIDSDADMAEEILAGADQARVVAGKCEEMTGRLEELYAKVQELKIPGVLAGMVVRLMEQAGEVRTRAEAVATALPRASEAIAQAGANAAARHRPLSDITREMGHAAPAERDYHKE